MKHKILFAFIFLISGCSLLQKAQTPPAIRMEYMGQELKDVDVQQALILADSVNNIEKFDLYMKIEELRDSIVQQQQHYEDMIDNSDKGRALAEDLLFQLRDSLFQLEGMENEYTPNGLKNVQPQSKALKKPK